MRDDKVYSSSISNSCQSLGKNLVSFVFMPTKKTLTP